jgi:bacteriocin biosynthesis cyclodehydratase domain-containing protein
MTTFDVPDTLDAQSAPADPIADPELVVNPALSVIRSSDDEIVVRFGSRSRTSRRLKDEGRHGLLGDLAEQLATPRRLSEVSAGVADPAGVLPAMLDHLREQKVVIDSADADYSFLLTGLDLADTSAIRQASVGVAGHGRIHDRVVLHLEDAGCELTAGAADDPDLFENNDLVVVCLDSPDAATLFDVNEVALTTRRPWQATFVDGAELVVGPLFVPGSTGCFHDFDTLDEAARSLRIDYLYYKSHQGARSGRPIPHFVADLAAAYATTSVLQHVGGAGSFLEGFVMRVDLERMELMREQLLQVPRCPACMQNRPHLRHPFL